MLNSFQYSFSTKSFVGFKWQLLKFSCNIYHLKFNKTFLWWFCRGCSPLPIPNRAVKPLMADGTTQQCGRVGSCHIYFKAFQFILEGFFGVSGMYISYRVQVPN